MKESLQGLLDTLRGWFESYPWLGTIVGVGAVLLLAALAFFVARRYLLRIATRIVRRTSISWDDVLVDEKILERLSLAAPFLVVYYGVRAIPGVSTTADQALERLALVGIILSVLLTIRAAFNAANTVYSRYPISRGRPIKGYLQIATIFVWVLGGILIVALLLDRSPWFFMTGLGAMTAVLLLIFRDTILSLVASIQIVSNDMVRIGDWIEMPKYGADGDVVDIALHTIKVQNFDKTITTIPTYKLIDDSFKNWRGMSESGGRRIKRSLHIDTGSVRFLTDEDVDRFSRFRLLAGYIESKRRELQESNRGQELHAEPVANVRLLTNVGTFRAYVVAYLRNHPEVHERGMTFLVRQLQPGPYGLPLEIYVFAKTTVWAEYERIQADIFDHLLAVIPEFGLRLYQMPAGHDLKRLGPESAERVGDV